MEQNKLCDYGCGKPALFVFKNGKCCCSKYLSQCIKMKIKNGNGNRGKLCSEIKKQNIGKGNIGKHKKRIVKENPGLCDYGCGKPALYYFGGSKKWCCSKSFNSCDKNKEINSKIQIERRRFDLKLKQKRRETMENNGKWIKLKDLDNFQLYQKEVWYFTNISSKEKFSKEELRQRGMKKEKYDKNLDHIFSITEGFKLGIMSKIIGSKSNIRLIDCSYNYKKNIKCDITLEELLKNYEEEINRKDNVCLD